MTRTYSDSWHLAFSDGYQPLPIVPHEKRPAIANWTADDYTPPTSGFKEHGIGVACGRGSYPVVGVDIDVTDEAVASEVTKILLAEFGETIYRIGKPPKILFVYRYEYAGVKKKYSQKYPIGRIEILGSGQQFVAFGIHPETNRPYSWPGILGSILDIPAADLPVLNDEKVNQLFKKFDLLCQSRNIKPVAKESTSAPDNFDADLDIPDRLGLTLENCKNILSKQNPDIEYPEWIQIGMALHFEFSGNPDAFSLWDEWSATGSKYPGTEQLQRHWDSFSRGYQGRLISGAYLKKLENDSSAPDPWEHEDFFRSLDWSTNRFVNNPPPIPMIIQNFLPAGGVSLFYSAGGAGKSTFILYMAIKITLGIDYSMRFLGNDLQGGKIAIITAEDPELILNRRYIAILQAVAHEMQVSIDVLRESVDRSLSVVSTFGHPVALFKAKADGSLVTTNYYDSLVKHLAEIKNLQLVIIDTKARFSPAESLGNVTATNEITYYEAIIRQTGAAVMLLHHSNKASRNGSQDGLQAFRGESALFDSVRSAWYLRGLRPEELKGQDLPDDDTRKYLLLENSKNNYIMTHEPMILFRDGYSYTPIKPKRKLSSAERKDRQLEGDTRRLIAALQTAKGVHWGLTEIRKEFGSGWRRCDKARDEALEMGLIEQVGTGRKKSYCLTDEGKMFDATIED